MYNITEYGKTQKGNDINMPFAEFRFPSSSLSHETSVCVILPGNGPYDDIPVLWLLHGMHGAHDSWIRKSNIERYAHERGIAVVTPEGENSFYHDMKYGKKYFTYISEELPEVIRRTFRISAAREKNFIAGLSMGGYGAVRTALLCPDRYAGCASLSGCVDIASTAEEDDESNAEFAVPIWGEGFRESVRGSDSDIFAILRSFPADKPLPTIYSCCGRQDFLWSQHEAFKALLEELSQKRKIDWTAEDWDGVHNWAFWSKHVSRAVDVITAPYLAK